MKTIFTALSVVGFALATISPAYAATEPKGTYADSRVKTAVYNENDVVSLRGHYGYQTTVSFATYEKIQNISIGDSVAWQVVPNKAGNILFLKPVEDNATTNMTVITDRRIYNFELTSGHAYTARDKNITYMMKFIYPNDNVLHYTYENDASGASVAPMMGATPYSTKTNITKTGLSSVGTPKDLNFDYSFKGEDDLSPSTVFDNGEFTYFKFGSMSDLPAIFEVEKDSNESVVNYHLEDGYVVVESLARQFTLRHGEDEACVFNDDFSNTRAIFANKEPV